MLPMISTPCLPSFWMFARLCRAGHVPLSRILKQKDASGLWCYSQRMTFVPRHASVGSSRQGIGLNSEEDEDSRRPMQEPWIGCLHFHHRERENLVGRFPFLYLVDIAPAKVRTSVGFILQQVRPLHAPCLDPLISSVTQWLSPEATSSVGHVHFYDSFASPFRPAVQDVPFDLGTMFRRKLDPIFCKNSISNMARPCIHFHIHQSWHNLQQCQTNTICLDWPNRARRPGNNQSMNRIHVTSWWFGTIRIRSDADAVTSVCCPNFHAICPQATNDCWIGQWSMPCKLYISDCSFGSYHSVFRVDYSLLLALLAKWTICLWGWVWDMEC